MTLVRKVDGAWQAWRGVNEAMPRTVSTATIVYADGRQETAAVAPYTVEDILSADRVETLLADGTWTAADLAAYGLVVAVPFVVPEGKQAVGEARYEEADDGGVNEVFDTADAPPAPPAPTPLERLAAAAGLTTAEMRQAIAEATGA